MNVYWAYSKLQRYARRSLNSDLLLFYMADGAHATQIGGSSFSQIQLPAAFPSLYIHCAQPSYHCYQQSNGKVDKKLVIFSYSLLTKIPTFDPQADAAVVSTLLEGVRRFYQTTNPNCEWKPGIGANKPSLTSVYRSTIASSNSSISVRKMLENKRQQYDGLVVPFIEGAAFLSSMH